MQTFSFHDLDVQEVNYILTQLNERPRREVNALVSKLELQLQQQVAQRVPQAQVIPGAPPMPPPNGAVAHEPVISPVVQ